MLRSVTDHSVPQNHTERARHHDLIRLRTIGRRDRDDPRDSIRSYARSGRYRCRQGCLGAGNRQMQGASEGANAIPGDLAVRAAQDGQEVRPRRSGPTLTVRRSIGAERSPKSRGDFGQQQGIVGRIDDAGKRRLALLAREAVDLEAALVDVTSVAAGERELRIALRARDQLGVSCPWQFGGHHLPMVADRMDRCATHGEARRPLYLRLSNDS